MLQCWVSVVDGGPTLKQHWANTLSNLSNPAFLPKNIPLNYRGGFLVLVRFRLPSPHPYFDYIILFRKFQNISGSWVAIFNLFCHISTLSPLYIFHKKYSSKRSGYYNEYNILQTDRSCACVPGQCEAESQYLEQLADVLRFSVPKDGPAGFYAEPIQVSNQGNTPDTKHFTLYKCYTKVLSLLGILF